MYYKVFIFNISYIGLVIIVNENIKKGKQEFKKRNYKKALKLFENVRRDDEDYEFSLLYRISCLMALNEYGDALKFIDFLIEKYPQEDLLWHDKVTCHVFLNEDEKAGRALSELERLVDVEDKERLLRIAKLYNMVRDDENALKYCDMALEVDENYREALYEKTIVVARLKDYSLMNEVADRLVHVCGNDLLALMPAFLLRLFSKNYRGCVDLINSADVDEYSDGTVHDFKAGLYNKMCENLNAQILVMDSIDLPVDDALNLMLDFHESGKDHGEVNGVQYFIL